VKCESEVSSYMSVTVGVEQVVIAKLITLFLATTNPGRAYTDFRNIKPSEH